MTAAACVAVGVPVWAAVFTALWARRPERRDRALLVLRILLRRK